MRKRMIRAGLPAVAVATALVLTGCNEDEESPSESAPSEEAEQGGGGGGDAGSGDAGSGDSEGPKPSDLSEIDPASLPEGIAPEDLVDLIPENLDDLIPWEELEDIELPDGEEERTPATIDELQGSWYTGPTSADAYLNFYEGEVTFIEDMLAEGDICYGTATDGALELTSCTMYGDVEWPARSATLEFEGSTLVVTWEDGTVQEYHSDTATTP
jgi:hypothetical protein